MVMVIVKVTVGITMVMVNYEMVHTWRASIELWMCAGNGRAREKRLSGTTRSRVFSCFSRALPNSQVHP